MRLTTGCIFLVTLALAQACAPDPCLGRRDMLLSPAGLELTEEEHPGGWGRSDCYACHVYPTLHQVSCSTLTDISMEEVQAQVDPDDPSSCVACHGSNGAG